VTNPLMWVGDFGEYEIPPKWEDVIRIAASGWPDRRYKEYRPFMEWVAAQEEARKMELMRNG
jgi:hypothetical protein